MEPVRGLNLNRRYISGLEPEVPVTMLTCSIIEEDGRSTAFHFGPIFLNPQTLSTACLHVVHNESQKIWSMLCVAGTEIYLYP